MFDRLDDILIHYEEIMQELGEPNVTENQDRDGIHNLSSHNWKFHNAHNRALPSSPWSDGTSPGPYPHPEDPAAS